RDAPMHDVLLDVGGDRLVIREPCPGENSGQVSAGQQATAPTNACQSPLPSLPLLAWTRDRDNHQTELHRPRRRRPAADQAGAAAPGIAGARGARRPALPEGSSVNCRSVRDEDTP